MLLLLVWSLGNMHNAGAGGQVELNYKSARHVLRGRAVQHVGRQSVNLYDRRSVFFRNRPTRTHPRLRIRNDAKYGLLLKLAKKLRRAWPPSLGKKTSAPYLAQRPLVHLRSATQHKTSDVTEDEGRGDTQVGRGGGGTSRLSRADSRGPQAPKHLWGSIKAIDRARQRDGGGWSRGGVLRCRLAS